MEAIIDTNILYALMGDENILFDIVKLKNELNKYDDYHISDLSILEIFFRYRNDKEKIIDVINFVANERISIHTLLPKQDSFHNLVNDELLNSEIAFKKFIDKVYELKVRTETEFFVFWFGSILVIMNLIMNHSDKIENTEKQMKMLSQFKSLIYSMEGKDAFIYQEIKKYIEEFYKDKKGSEFREKIVELLLNLLSVSVVSYEMSKNNKTVFELNGIDNVDLNEDIITDILEGLNNNPFLNNINDRMKKEKEIIKKKFIDKEFEDSLNLYMKNIAAKVGAPMAKYITLLFDKILSLKGKVFDKNDIFDSLLLKYIPDYILLTFDGNFLKTLQIISENSYFESKKIYNLCKIKV